MGETNYLIAERNRELQRAFDKLIGECGAVCTVEEIYDMMETMPSRRFWVSGNYAYDRVMRRKELVGRKKQMYKEIYMIARKYAEKTGVGMREAVYYAVERPASSFYMHKNTMRNVLLNGLKR